MGSLACASVISVMMSHCTGARIRDVGMTGSLGTSGDVVKSNCLERASQLQAELQCYTEPGVFCLAPL